MSSLFLRLVARPLAREPLRTTLTVFAVALGVAVVIAIALAGNAAAGSFHSSLEALTGKSDLTIRATGGIDENLLGRLVQLPYAFDFIPRIESFAFLNGKGEALPFIGLDLIGHPEQANFGNAKGEVSSLTAGDPIWVGAQTALHQGQKVKLLIGDRVHTFRVAGVFQGNAIVADIGLAQAVTGKAGRLDSIDVRTPPDHTVDYWRALLQRELPPSVTVEPRGARTQENRKMLAAFRWNLRILSYIALIVGGFLIYNTISISVVRRRAEIGILRALGATRPMIRAAFLAESLVFGVLGSLAGLGLGRILAGGAIRMIGSTVESLYVSSQPGPIQFTPGVVLSGIGVGIGMALLAALAPAWEASAVAPAEAMARGRNEYTVSVRASRFALWALLFLIAAGVCCLLPPVHGEPRFGYAASLLL
ncbi:MAG: ABC transporter permease, partial [Bryobacteraceae bacterium]